MALSFKTVKMKSELVGLVLRGIAKLLLNYFGMETLKELQFAFDTSQISRSTYFRKLKKIREGESLKEEKGVDAREKLRENSFKKLSQLPSKIPIFPQKNGVEKKTPKKVPELREKNQESQHILTSEMRSNLMTSVSVRLNEVISSKGKQIRL